MASPTPVATELTSLDQSSSWENCFLGNSPASLANYSTAVAAAVTTLKQWFATQLQPYSGATPRELAAGLANLDICPEQGKELANILSQVGESVLQHSVVVNHPTCIAHLHCPPLVPALAAEVLISATNQSLDSWDQSPAATLLEQQLVNWLCDLYGYATDSDGIFTSGGTQSNFMGLLLARDRYSRDRLGWLIQQQGLPPEASRFRILCSTVSHFTVQQSAALLGLGSQAVVTVETDAAYQLCPAAVERQLAELQQQNLLPIALVATAGTTDFGSIDPLPALAAIAKKYQLWLHVDAAYGGALILSEIHRQKLAGIAAADSLTVDFHKLFYQPISCGAFLLKNRADFDLIKLHADYLNPEANKTEGIPDLVTKSIQTTRRFDTLKLFISLQALGRQQLAEMIDTTIKLAQETATIIAADPALELATYPTINAVVFRYLPPATPARTNQINSQIRLSLIQAGVAIIAQTQWRDRTYLKFTLLNPQTTLVDIQSLLNRIKQIGIDLSQQV